MYFLNIFDYALLGLFTNPLHKFLIYFHSMNVQHKPRPHDIILPHYSNWNSGQYSLRIYQVMAVYFQNSYRNSGKFSILWRSGANEDLMILSYHIWTEQILHLESFKAYFSLAFMFDNNIRWNFKELHFLHYIFGDQAISF